jgi:hypothetical protein
MDTVRAQLVAERDSDFGRHLNALEHIETWRPAVPGSEARFPGRGDAFGRLRISQKPYRMVAAGLTPEASGTWEELRGGGRVWRIRVRVDSAPWIGLSFDRLELRPGALLRVYGPLLHEVVGPFASGDRGQLVIPTLAGDTAVVELYWPQQYHDEMPSLRLGTVFYGTEGDRGAPASESAHRDGEGVAAFLEGWQAAQATT